MTTNVLKGSEQHFYNLPAVIQQQHQQQRTSADQQQHSLRDTHQSHPVAATNILPSHDSAGAPSSLDLLASTATCSSLVQPEYEPSRTPSASDNVGLISNNKGYSPSPSLRPAEAHTTTLHLTEIPVQHQEVGGSQQTIANRLFHIHHMPPPTANTTTTYHIPHPSVESTGIKTTSTPSNPASIPPYPYPSPPYSSPPFNPTATFKTILNNDTASPAHSSITAYSPSPGIVSTGMPIAGVSILEPNQKTFIEHPHQLPGSQTTINYANLFPKLEPTSPGSSCLHTPLPTVSGIPPGYYHPRPPINANGPWSAPPIQSTHSAFTYPNGTGGFRPLSPISPISPSCMSSPGSSQAISLYAATPTDTQQLTHVDALRWPSLYFDPNVVTTRRIRRVACTCPNCMKGLNSKSTNPDGTPKKKQHICHYEGCNKVYGKTSHLRAHLRWHTGDRPFACNWYYCGKRFTRSDELQRHLRTHTGEKKFVCPECSKRFMRSDHLNKHIKTHQKTREKCVSTKPNSSPPCSPSSTTSGGPSLPPPPLEPVPLQQQHPMCSPIIEDQRENTSDNCSFRPAPPLPPAVVRPNNLIPSPAADHLQATASITSLHQGVMPHLMLPPPHTTMMPLQSQSKPLTQLPCVQ